MSWGFSGDLPRYMGGYICVKSRETSLPLILFGLQFLVYFLV